MNLIIIAGTSLADIVESLFVVVVNTGLSSGLQRIALTNDEFLDLLAMEARSCYNKVGATKCESSYTKQL